MSNAKEPLQIDAPELLTAPERARDTIFTAVMWVVYLYLWVPLISLFAWWLGAEFAYDVMIRSGGAAGLRDVLFVYSIIISVILLTVTAWSLSNKIRFGKLVRRREHVTVSDDKVSGFFDIDQSVFATLRSEPIVSVDFADGGKLVVADRNDEKGSDPFTE